MTSGLDTSDEFPAYPGKHQGSLHPVPRIFVVADDAVQRGMVVTYLDEHGFRTVQASGGRELQRRLIEREPDLVILDTGLGGDGLILLREIRSRSEVPVIIIAAGDGPDDIDRVVGLELGADDYITKQFSPRELLARVRAVLRRRTSCVVALHQHQSGGNRWEFEGWQLNGRSRHLSDPNGARVELTKGEYALLSAFISAPQRPLTRAHLLQATHVHDDVFDRSIDVQILRLRRKLKTRVGGTQMIQTIYGIGYEFMPAVKRL